MGELIDLVNHRGEIIKRAVERDDMSSYNGLYLQNIVTVVMNGMGQVLVQKRAGTKPVSPGNIDHVCGAILSGESPEAAARRETYQENGGLTLDTLTLVKRGLNAYGRYRYLYKGEAGELPSPLHLNPREVEWIAYYDPEALRTKNTTGQFTFVKGFFEDLDEVLAA